MVSTGRFSITMLCVSITALCAAFSIGFTWGRSGVQAAVFDPKTFAVDSAQQDLSAIVRLEVAQQVEAAVREEVSKQGLQGPTSTLRAAASSGHQESGFSKADQKSAHRPAPLVAKPRNEERFRKSMFYGEQGMQTLPSKSPWSQYNQDIWAAQKFQAGGFYLDIGAHHANFMSNTRMLDDLGWSGLCVEPLIYKYRDWHLRSCTLLSAALVPEATATGNITFHNCEEGVGTSGKSGITELINVNEPGRRGCPDITVRAVPTGELLNGVETPRVVQYMSLDVEGAELQLLKTIPWESFCMELATIENNHNRDDIRQWVTEKLPHKCRHVFRRSVDDFYECDCSKMKQD